MANPTLSADGTVTLVLLPGRTYTLAAGGTFGGGSLAAVQLLDDDTPVPVAGSPFTAAGQITLTASASRLRLTLTGSTTPAITYNVNLASDSLAAVTSLVEAYAAKKIETKTANFTAVNLGNYVATATLTVTDPTPSEGASFTVLVRNGTATVGGAAYTVAGTLILRVYHSGAWASYTYATISGVATLTNKRVPPRITTITSSATPTVNTDDCDMVTITALAAAITSMTSGLTGTPNNGEMLLYRIKDNGTARAITWGASFAAAGASLPTTTVLGKVLHVLFIWDSVAAKWFCLSTAQEA
jgi:hypothetical protein